MEVTVDTHALIWFWDAGLFSKLSPAARHHLETAELEGVIHIPIIVLTEILHLSEKGKIARSFSDLYGQVKESSNYRIVPFTPAILELAASLTGLETHDRIILATARFVETPLVSKDETLRQYAEQVVW